MGIRSEAEKVDVPALFRMWATNVSSQEICETLAVSRTQLFRLCQRHGLPKRPRVSSASKFADISQQEIAARAAQIRESWSESEERKRAGHIHSPVETKSYSFDGRDVVFRY